MKEDENLSVKFDSVESAVQIQSETETEPVKEKKQLTDRQKFWIRLGLYVLFGLLLPCAFLIWRCDIFSGQPATLGFWGFLLALLVSLFCSSTLKWVRKGMKFSIYKQMLDGAIRVIVPLITALLFVVVIKNNVDLVVQCLSCIIACECVAIPINPLPSLYYKNAHQEYEGIIDMAVDKFFTRKEKSDK